MHHDLLVRGGRVATAGGIHIADVAASRGKIVAVGDLGSDTADQVLEAKGLTVLPGIIDTQVHFREPGLEHKEDLESGTRAALLGGVTSILEMPNTDPATTTEEALADKLRRAEGRAWCHYGFFVGASTENLDQLAALERLPGTPGIKVFVGSSTGSLLVSKDADLLEAMRNGRKTMPIHAEDEARNVWRRKHLAPSSHPREHPYLRDAESARLATSRVLRLAAEAGRPVHILHVSTGEEPVLIAEAKRAGQPVTAEVTPQHLLFHAPDCYDRLGSLAQMNPPIRGLEHRDRLWSALEAGVFDVFGSDHAPHTLAEKAKPFPSSPSGMPGVQTLLPVLLTFVAEGRLALETVVQMACTRPASLYGIQGKGRIEPGCDADLTLVDPDATYVFDRSMVESKCGWSPYEGERLIGRVEHVVLGGEVAVRDRVLVDAPAGRMLRFNQAEG